MNRNDRLEELGRIVGKENLLSTRRDLLVYEYDAANETFLPEAGLHHRPKVRQIHLEYAIHL
ncbi:MAG: hypothetical protein M1380_01705, partial [Chloroflexi bacterium]|nr:hypothetical protein [Chloroflexota bacterium]